MLRRFFTRKILIASLAVGVVLGILFWNCLPEPLFSTTTSTVLLDRKGNLLGALVAADGQWRFPHNGQVCPKFEKCITRFEDKRFYKHPGVDPLALGRATWQHLSGSESKSGGSTLTTQVIRLSRNGKPRTVWQKAIEMTMALRLECSYSKKEILAMYASNAPYGSNVVGLDAAAWRYYGKNQLDLSWGEAATLAVLPNSPSLVHPGKNRDILKRKRDKLLEKMLRAGDIDSLTCMLAMAESLPGKPYPLPRYAPHLLSRVYTDTYRKSKGRPQVAQSSIDKDLQEQVNNILARHHGELKGNGINNAAALVADVETGEVLAYVGNIYNQLKPEPEGEVDVITAPRSTGSILKPLLFAHMLNEGEILPGTLVPDIPTQIAGYAPRNFNKECDGAVAAKRALERSLNIPAVRMLRIHGIEKFHRQLQQMGISTLNRPAGNYGLSLILGGAEGSMWDIAGVYASMARTLNHYSTYKGQYRKEDFHPLTYHMVKRESGRQAKTIANSAALLSASSIWCTFNAMEEVSRPDMESNWQDFSSSQRIAWKTGTSFGFRDGWSVGVTPKYVVIVWAGNADGEGRPGLVGIATAAPIMFDIFKLLKNGPWFEQPYSDMKQVELCSKSGYRAAGICDEKQLAWVPAAGQRTAACPFHQLVHLDATGKWRVDSECEPPSNMQHQSWFVLPPAQEWYYKSRNPQYRVLPPYRPDCQNANRQLPMEFIYPKKSLTIYVPVELDGKTGKAVFEVAHRLNDAVLYWHLDDEYLGLTKGFHQMALNPEKGKHLLAVVDGQGERLELNFEVMKK